MILLMRHYLHHPASRAIGLRGGLVGVHVGVLAGLAVWLGLDGFGTLVVLWGLALVASTVLGFGGPLHLLARLGDGAGMHPRAVFAVCAGLPCLAAAAVWPVLHLVWPEVPWPAVLALALAVHLTACLASILRAFGSVQMSMALRDGAPVLALGLAGVSRLDAAAILWLAAAGLGALCLLAGWRVWQHDARRDLIGRDRPARGISANLWAVAVLGMVLAQIDIIIGGQFLTAEQIGIYALVRKLANLVALPISVATWVSAGPISAAHAARDLPALQRASTAGARIALLPGLALAMVALALAGWLPRGSVPVLGVLLAGTVVQLAFAQGMTVATLTGRGHLAAGARLAGVLAYLGAALVVAAPLDPLGNALAYVLGTSLCAALLWLALWHDAGINTLVWRTGGRAWRMS